MYKGGKKMRITQQRFKQLREKGYTLEQIGAKYHISRQRVFQILTHNYQRQEAPQPAINQIVYPTIKQWLIKQEMTPKELALAANIPYYTLYCFLVGKTKKPQQKTLLKLSQYTDIPLGKLLEQK